MPNIRNAQSATEDLLVGVGPAWINTTPMTVLNGPPTDVAAPNSITAEMSNCTYGTLPQGTSKLYVQTF